MTEFAIKISSLEEAQQHAFKLAVAGLASQRWAACVSTVGQSQGCSWNLGVPGVHCAIGWLVPWPKQSWTHSGSYMTALNSELLHPALVAWYRLHRLRPDGGQLQGFLEALQAAHDSGGTPAKMTGRFKALGIQFGLKWPKEESDE